MKTGEIGKSRLYDLRSRLGVAVDPPGQKAPKVGED